MQFKGFTTDHKKSSNRIPVYDSDAELPLLSKTIGEMPLALFLAFFFSSKQQATAELLKFKPKHFHQK